MRAQRAHSALVARVALEVRAVARRRTLIRQTVDVIHMDEAGQASRDQAGLQALGSQRQVRGRDKAAEGLAERRPRVIAAQLVAQRLRVVHDLVLAEVAQVRGLLLVRVQVRERLGVHAGRLARASLIEEHHPVVLEETIHPPAGKRAETRARVARAALQEHRVGGVLAALAHDLAREHLNRRVILADRAQVIQRDCKTMLVNRVSVVNVRLCVHGHNGSGFGVVPLPSVLPGAVGPGCLMCPWVATRPPYPPARVRASSAARCRRPFRHRRSTGACGRTAGARRR